VVGSDTWATAEAEPRAAAPSTGKEAAALGEARLRLVLRSALGERQWRTSATVALAQACGRARGDECARWLCLRKCCVAHAHWLGVWLETCSPRDRAALLVRLVAFVRERALAGAVVPPGRG